MDSYAKLIPLGKTWYNRTVSSSEYAATAKLEGIYAIFNDEGRPSWSGLISPNSANRVRAILVRNVSGGELAPGRVVVWQTGNIGKRVSGYANTGVQPIAGVVDPSLPANVKDGDLFWCIVGGPTTMYTVASGLTAISAGDPVVVGANDGRINKFNAAPASATEALTTALAVVGIAMESRTTAQTNTATKVMITRVLQ